MHASKAQILTQARRRVGGNVLVANGFGTIIATAVGSSSSWVTYRDGGPTPTVHVTGLDGGAGGWRALGIAVLVLLGSVYAAALVPSRFRGLLAVVPSLFGVIYAIHAWGGPAMLSSGVVFRGSVGVGLVIVLAAFSCSSIVCLLVLVNDCRRIARIR